MRLLKNVFNRKVIFWILFVFIFFLPFLATEFYQLPSLAFDNFTDAVFYPAYATNFSELVLRHGFIYYALRFGVIFPDALASWLFGAPDGWLFARAAVQSLLLVLVYLFFAKRGGWAAGAVAVLLWWTNPVALRILCTTYLDSLAVPFFLAGTLLLAWPNSKVWMALLAGALWGLAASAHLYLLILIPLMVPFLLGSRWNDIKGLLSSILCAGGGALCVWAIAYFYYRGVWGVVDLWAPTKELMSGMAAGDTEKWKSPLGEALARVPAWFAPLVVLAGTGGFLRRGAMVLWGAWLSLAAATSFFWLGDLMGGAYALSMPFYFSFLFPALFLLTATGISEIMVRAAESTSGKKCEFFSTDTKLFFALAVLLVGGSSVLTRIMTPAVAWATIVALAMIALSGFWISLPQQVGRWKGIAFAIALCSSQLLILGTPFFSQYLAKYRRLHRSEVWQPELAEQLFRILPPAALDGRSLRFWYDDEKPGLIRMVQASFLHHFSQILDENILPANFPEPPEWFFNALRSSGTEVLVILDEKPEAVGQAASLLTSQLPEWEVIREGVLKYRGKQIHYAIVEHIGQFEIVDDHSGGLRWTANAPARLVSLAGNRELLRSSSRRWMFEAESLLPEFTNPGEILFEGQILQGRFMLSLLDKNDTTVASTEMWPTKQPTVRRLPFPGGQNGARLVLRNMMPEGSESEIVILRTVAREQSSKL